jgi:hypothetical protein
MNHLAPLIKCGTSNEENRKRKRKRERDTDTYSLEDRIDSIEKSAKVERVNNLFQIYTYYLKAPLAKIRPFF